MDAILLSRWQFAITTIYHFLFIPLTLGLSLFIAILETLYVKTGKEQYKQMTKFWGKLFLVNFAMGVVTGIVQEFHFGMNWSEYSRFMGDIFGAPLALEALTAFFIESTFLGLWIFGWDRLSKKIHLACIWLVAFASNLSAFWILVANSFMQHPVGYTIRNGRAEMLDFTALLTNPYVAGQFSHTVLSGIVTAGFFVVSISAYHLLRKTHVESFTSTMKIGLVWTIIGLFAVMGSGHLQAQSLIHTQPMKLASIEALWKTENPAPFTLYTQIDQEKQKNSSQIAVPGMLSFMVYNQFDGEIKGLTDLQKTNEQQFGPGDYIPDVPGLFWSFRIMVLAGVIMIGIAIINAFYIFTNKSSGYALALKALLFALPLPYIANSTGWYVTEGGRQPWIVVGLQKVSTAISPNITTTEVWISLIGFTLIYTILAYVAIYVSVKFIKKGPETPLQSMKGGRA
ncbi:cytochrome ubiquinol oxidase subunit I [Anaerosinus massiliensis]|uniref:cytochrome ubiquinol oxidase subunit I n=1 Tax=Massilibacillus massiliensis TaxID=1806837 RepID=UPI000A7D78D9|nr:cytochrome ubiquinol oxidase subunit I [Massilibacillus massiliensis]